MIWALLGRCVLLGFIITELVEMGRLLVLWRAGPRLMAQLSPEAFVLEMGLVVLGFLSAVALFFLSYFPVINKGRG